MVSEFHHSDASFNVPQYAGHVARTSDNLSVVEETAAAKVSGVGAKLAGAPASSVAISVAKVVDGTNVIKATTCDEISRW